MVINPLTKDYPMISAIDIQHMNELKISQPVAASGVAATLQERGKRYGSFAEHANIAQALKEVMWQNNVKWFELANDQKQALEVIADKVARILNGDPNYVDNWHDIQGYAKLVEDRLNENKEGSAG